MLLCVGERRSATAIARGWTWADGRLAARTLHAALGALGLRYGRDYTCCNILDDDGVFHTDQMRGIAAFAQEGWQIVALGHVAARYLTAYGIPHLCLIHPAARGAIRRQARYQAHVASLLQPCLGQEETP
jgi:hypothetical protein